MAEQNAVATQQGTQLSVAAQVKSMISQDAVKKKFTEVLGQKAPQFLASITNVVAGSAQLKKCPATTIMSAAFVAATYDLPIDSNLGFAAIVPYNNNKYNPQKLQQRQSLLVGMQLTCLQQSLKQTALQMMRLMQLILCLEQDLQQLSQRPEELSSRVAFL